MVALSLEYIWRTIWSQSVQPFGNCPSLLIFDPLNPQKFPPGISRGWLFLFYVHSQMNEQTCTKFRANWSSHLVYFPDFCICDPQNIQNSHLGSREAACFAYIIYYADSQIIPQTCTKFGANRSIRFVASTDFFELLTPHNTFLVKKNRWDQMEKMATWFFMFTILFRIFLMHFARL